MGSLNPRGERRPPGDPAAALGSAALGLALGPGPIPRFAAHGARDAVRGPLAVAVLAVEGRGPDLAAPLGHSRLAAPRMSADAACLRRCLHLLRWGCGAAAR